MALTQSKAIDLLNEIVGVTKTAYLALSSTKPRIIPVGSTNPYNVTEPSGSSYKRTLLYNRGYFDDTSSLNHIISSEASITVQNTAEIHFTECTDEGGWGTFGYFAIYTSLTGGAPIYVGKLVNEIVVAQNTVPLIRAENLQISILSSDLDA